VKLLKPDATTDGKIIFNFESKGEVISIIKDAADYKKATLKAVKDEAVAEATSTANTLIDGLDLNATGIFDNITDKGDNGKSRQVVDEKGGTNDYITGRILEQNAASLAGKYYIFYTVV
jgi:hypothetical protein